MTERIEDETRTEAPSPRSQANEELSYRIELWRDSQPSSVERVLARACSATLAQAIYRAAQSEHPDRRITLSHGDRLMADTAAQPRPE